MRKIITIEFDDATLPIIEDDEPLDLLNYLANELENKGIAASLYEERAPQE